MLNDLYRWHGETPSAVYRDLATQLIGPTAVLGDPLTSRRVPLLAPGAGDFSYNAVDFSVWQVPDPTWHAMSQALQCVRMGDGGYLDPIFVDSWRTMQSNGCRWPGFYILPDPHLGVNGQLALVRDWYARTGVPFGRAGHWYSIDDEPTPSHGQFTGNAMRDLRKGLEDIFQREELHYVGFYNGNYGFIENEGWWHWGPWPLGNGPLPSWNVNLVLHQWGVASAGEVPGFPNQPVDVNQMYMADVMDRLSGYEEDIVATLAEMEDVFRRVLRSETGSDRQPVDGIGHLNLSFEAYQVIRQIVKETVEALAGLNIHGNAGNDGLINFQEYQQIRQIVNEEIGKLPATGPGGAPIDYQRIGAMVTEALGRLVLRGPGV